MRWLVVKMMEIIIFCAVVAALVFLHVSYAAGNCQEFYVLREQRFWGWLLTKLLKVNKGTSSRPAPGSIWPCSQMTKEKQGQDKHVRCSPTSPGKF